MPRSGRGGARQGTPSQAYGNRTDLNASLPVQTVTGQGYGVAAAQQAAQRAIPVAAQPVPGANAPVGQNTGPLAQPQAPAQPQATTITGQLPPTQMYPGELKFGHPTDVPEEPITAGLPFGDGPGPEVLHTFTPQIGESLAMMARQPNAPASLIDLASAAKNIGL